LGQGEGRGGVLEGEGDHLVDMTDSHANKGKKLPPQLGRVIDRER